MNELDPKIPTEVAFSLEKSKTKLAKSINITSQTIDAWKGRKFVNGINGWRLWWRYQDELADYEPKRFDDCSKCGRTGGGK